MGGRDRAIRTCSAHCSESRYDEGMQLRLFGFAQSSRFAHYANGLHKTKRRERMARSKYQWLLVAVCLAALCIAGRASYGQKRAQSKTSWEYKRVFVQEKDFGKTDEILNANGADGWELVQAESWKPGYMFYLK